MVKNAITSPLWLIGTMMLVIFVAEAVVMLGFFMAGESQSLISGFLDATILSLVISLPMYLLIFRPMSQQHRRLQRSQRWLQTITDNLPEALIEIDSKGIINAFNPTAETMFGYTSFEMIGKSINQLMPGEGGEDHDAFVNLYLETGVSHVPNTSREIKARRRDGRIFPAEILVREIQHESKLYFIGIIRDLTHHKHEQHQHLQMMERLERTQRLESLGVLAGGIAHDFNNILAAIQGNAELLQMQVGERQPETDKSLTNIQASCGQAAELCRQMLAYAGRGQYQPEYIDMNELIHSMDALIRVTVPRTITVEKHLADGLPTIYADRAQAEQVMLNLLSNSAEAIGDKEEGKIVVTTKLHYATAADLAQLEQGVDLQPGPYVVVKVRDNDSGIMPENMAHLFEPFFTTKFTGRGLGMSAVLGILRAHHGGIGVESQPGKGTTVSIFLPIRQKKKSERDVAAVMEPFSIDWTGSGTVLVVDDESQFRDMVCKMLRHLGFDTIEAKNGEQGLEMAARHRERIAVVLLDLTMPVMGGEKAFLHLRSLYPELPVLIASGYGEERLREMFGEDGPEGFVSKPFRFGDLRRAMYKVVRVPPQAGKPD